jgi:hypothetical protein
MDEQSQLLESHLYTVSMVAMRCLLRVTLYGEPAWMNLMPDSDLPFKQLPTMPELGGHRYVYVRSCTGD